LRQFNFYEILKKKKAEINKLFFSFLNSIFTDKKYYEHLKLQIKNIPVSNGSKYYKKFLKKVGIIADEFVFENFKPTCDLIYLTPKNWQNIIADLDCVIITSVWHGLNNEWFMSYNKNSFSNRVISDIANTAKKLNIKVIFYSKEDPPNYNYFYNIAEKCDYIFTSSIECVQKYKVELNNEKCFELPFSVNPLLYNPIGMYRGLEEKSVIFAGSWMKKYPDRIKSQKYIFNMLLKEDLSIRIIDRNYYLSNTNYRYPIKLLKYVIPCFSYTDLAAVYKLHEYVLNFNSVTESQTMFAARVCDACACGAIILSNKSNGMIKKFPNVKIINEKEQLDKIINLSQKQKWKLRKAAIRNCFRMGTVFESMEFVLNKSDIIKSTNMTRKVVVILSPDISNVENYIKMFFSQTYENKRIILKYDKNIDISNCDIVAIWGEKHSYSRYYLEDMINCFKFTNCDYIVKNSSFKNEQCEYTNRIEDKYSAVFWLKSFDINYLMNLPDNDISLENGFAY